MKKSKFTKNSTIGEILNDPQGVAVFQKYSPILLYNPIIKYAYQFPLKVIKFAKFDKEINLSGKLSRKIIKEILQIEE